MFTKDQSKKSRNQPNQHNNGGRSFSRTQKPPTVTGYNGEGKKINIPSNPKAVRFVPLGGLGVFGKNMSLLEYGDDILIVDCGIMFPNQEMLGIDFVIPDITYLLANKHKIRGIIFTHAHEDHIGATPYIWPKLGCPMYANDLTAALLRSKFEEFGLPTDKIQKIKAGDHLKMGVFDVETFPMGHIISGDIGLLVHSPVGNFVHIADFRFAHRADPEVDRKTLEKLAEIGHNGVYALFMDSTNVEEEGKSISEAVVEENISDIVARAKGRVIVTSFASAIKRIQIVVYAAQKAGRKVAFFGRSMERNVEMTVRLGYLKIPKEVLVPTRKIKNLPDDKVVIICTGSQGEEFSALSRMSRGEHRQIRVKAGDTIVVSGSAIPGNERSIADVVNNLFKMGADVIYGGESAEIHASGHARREDLAKVIRTLRPKYFVPIHGEYRHLVLHARLAQENGVDRNNTFVVEDGQILEFARNYVKILKAHVPSGYVLIDGLGIGDVGNIVLRDRQAMAKEGILVAITTIDRKTKKMLTSPDIISRGFIYMRENEELVFNIRQRVKKLATQYVQEHPNDFALVKTKLRDNISEYIFNETQRRPLIIPVIIEV